MPEDMLPPFWSIAMWFCTTGTIIPAVIFRSGAVPLAA